MVEEERKYVDVNVFVYWLAGSGDLLLRAKRWIQRIETARRGEYYTSALTIYEVMVIIAGLTGDSLQNEEFVDKVLSAFDSLRSLTVLPLEKEIFVEALRCMYDVGLDFEDCLHYATAKRIKAGVIISNDKDFDLTDLRRLF